MSPALHAPWHQRNGPAVVVCGALLVMAACLIQGFALAAGDPSEPPSLSPAAVAFAATLAVFGWTQSSIAAMRGLTLSTELGTVFALNESMHDNLYAFAAMLRRCYGAESSIVVLDGEPGSAARLYVADGLRAKAPRGEPLDPRLAQALLAVPTDRLVLFRRALFAGGTDLCRSYDCRTLETKPVDPAAMLALAGLLEARSFLSIPLRSRDRTLGRVHLVARRRGYRQRDLRSLAQLVGQAGSSIESMQLVDRLSLTVANQERRRISRDLHDGTVQPYIGLKLGLEALRRRLGTEGTLVREVDELIRMAGDGLTELRQYVGSLKVGSGECQPQSVVQGVRYQARKFSEFYGVGIDVACDREIAVSSHLYEEVMHIVREALSNIRRHTAARRASINLCAANGALVLEIANERGEGASDTPPFHPRSIHERARDLGGRVSVAQRTNGDTVVAVELPV